MNPSGIVFDLPPTPSAEDYRSNEEVITLKLELEIGTLCKPLLS